MCVEGGKTDAVVPKRLGRTVGQKEPARPGELVGVEPPLPTLIIATVMAKHVDLTKALKAPPVALSSSALRVGGRWAMADAKDKGKARCIIDLEDESQGNVTGLVRYAEASYLLRGTVRGGELILERFADDKAVERFKFGRMGERWLGRSWDLHTGKLQPGVLELRR